MLKISNQDLELDMEELKTKDEKEIVWTISIGIEVFKISFFRAG